jgi:hypothetical protein
MTRRAALRSLAAVSWWTRGVPFAQCQDRPNGFDVPGSGSLLVTVKDRVDGRQTHIRHVISDPLSWSDVMTGFDPAFLYSPEAKALYVASRDTQDHYSLGIIDFTNARAPLAIPYRPTKNDWRSSPQIALSPDGKRLYTLRNSIHHAQISPSSIPRGMVVNDLDASYEELVLFTFDLQRMAFLPVRLPQESAQFTADEPLLDWRRSWESGFAPDRPLRAYSRRRGESYVVELGRMIRQKGNQRAESPTEPVAEGQYLHEPALGGDDQFLYVPVGPRSYAPAEPGKWSLRIYLTDSLRKMTELPSPRPIFRLKSDRNGRIFFDILGGKIQVLESETLGLIREIEFDGEEVTSVDVLP